MKESIDILCQVAVMAQKAGLLSLKDAVLVAQAIEMLNPKEVEAEAEVE